MASQALSGNHIRNAPSSRRCSYEPSIANKYGQTTGWYSLTQLNEKEAVNEESYAPEYGASSSLSLNRCSLDGRRGVSAAEPARCSALVSRVYTARKNRNKKQYNR